MIRSYRRTLPGDRRKLLERYRYVHAARKVVGVGSVGTRAFIMLLLGRDGDDPLFLQFKEAEASVLEPFLGKSEFANHGQRVVEGQRLTQAASDIMLGWIRAERPSTASSATSTSASCGTRRASALVELMEPDDDDRLREGSAATELARAHARAGDAVAIASYLGASDTFDRCAGPVRRGVRRPERTRLQDAHRRSQGRPDQGRDGGLACGQLRADEGSGRRRTMPAVSGLGAQEAPR